MPFVKEIVIDGNIHTNRLFCACKEYTKVVKRDREGEIGPMLTFKIKMDDGKIKAISFQQAILGVYIYGLD